MGIYPVFQAEQIRERQYHYAGTGFYEFFKNDRQGGQERRRLLCSRTRIGSPGHHFPEQGPLLRPGGMPPDGEGFGIVSGGSGERNGRVIGGVYIIFFLLFPVFLPAHYFIAGDACFSQDLAHIGRDKPEVLAYREHRRGRGQRGNEPPAPVLLVFFSLDVEMGLCAAVLRNYPGAEKTHHVVYAVDIVKLRRPFELEPPPLKTVLFGLIPAAGGHAPILAFRGKRVRRGAYREAQIELALPGPDIGGFTVDHEREVPVKTDAELGRPGAGLVPLPLDQPLHILEIVYLQDILAAYPVQGFRVAPGKVRGPLSPGDPA